MAQSAVDRQNEETLAAIKAAGLTDPADVAQKRKAHPYRGFIDLPLPGGAAISLFCNNDDLTALQYLWVEGYREEPYSLEVWAELVRGAATILDIGAHVGLYALAANKINPAARILAFEAIDFIFARLIVNIAANSAGGRIKARHIGVSDRAGWTQINLNLGPEVMTKGASIKGKPERGEPIRKWLQTDTVDVMAEGEAVDLIKIDVEGHEFPVFQGAQKVLQTHKPTVICEILRRDVGNGEIFKMFEAMGYRCHLIQEEERSLLEIADYAQVNDLRGGSRNFLFSHPSRADALKGLG